MPSRSEKEEDAFREAAEMKEFNILLVGNQESQSDKVAVA
jgi:hypothetical protein